MASTPADIVNEAIQLIGGYNNVGKVTGTPPNFDGTVIGIAAGAVYTDTVKAVARQHGFDFSRCAAVLVLSGNVPPVNWAFEYLYPANGVQVRQVLPMTIADANDPKPVNWSVGNASVASIITKVIWTNQAGAEAYFTNQPPESLWDGLFTEAVVRLLASKLAAAVEGKPDTMQMTLQQAEQFEQIGEQRDG